MLHEQHSSLPCPKVELHLSSFAADAEEILPEMAGILEGIGSRIDRCAADRQEILLYVLGGFFKSIEVDDGLAARFLVQVLVILTASHERVGIDRIRELAKAAGAEILLGEAN